MRRDPAPAQLPDADGSGCRGTGHPEVIESGEDPSAGLQLETEPEATVPPAGLDHAGRLGLGPRDPLRLPPHTACPAEPAPGFAVPPLEHGRSLRVPQRTGQERGCLLVPGLRKLIQKLFDYGARRFGDGAPAQGGEGRDESDRRDRDDGKTEETFHDPEASNPCAASGPAGRQAAFCLRSRRSALSACRSPRRPAASFSTGARCRSIVRPRSKDWMTDG